MELQQQIAYQLDLFTEQKQNAIAYSENRKDVIGAKARTGKQINGKGQQGRALAEKGFREQGLYNLESSLILLNN